MPHRFVVLSDTHFLEPPQAADAKTWWNRVLEKQCTEIGAALVRTINQLEPDFVIHCGDFTGHCNLANYEFGLEIMNRLGCPWHVVPGNHDTWFPGVRAALAARCQQQGDDCYYARDLAGLRFVFLDVAYWSSTNATTSPYLDQELYDRGQIVGMGPSPEELVWLERELASAGRPIALVSHAPLGYKPAYPIPTLPRGEPARQPQTSVSEFMGDVLQRQVLRDLIRRCSLVKVAFAGHWHICDTIREDGVTFCQTAALREYPFEFRLVTVEAERLSITTHGLDDDSFQHQSYVEAWGNRWVAGTPSDRSFEVKLK
jgi:3',5'-cyclic AMP phosphodiesterase CpdA